MKTIEELQKEIEDLQSQLKEAQSTQRNRRSDLLPVLRNKKLLPKIFPLYCFDGDLSDRHTGTFSQLLLAIKPLSYIIKPKTTIKRNLKDLDDYEFDLMKDCMEKIIDAMYETRIKFEEYFIEESIDKSA